MPVKYKILVADDDEIFCYVLKEQLVEAGHQVSSANSGEKIFEHLQKSPIDLLFLDMHMPDKSGLELLPEILQLYPSLPVIFLTGANDAKTAIDAIRAGAFDYLLKPYNFEELLIVAGRAVEHSNLQIKSSALEIRTSSKHEDKIIGSSDLMKELIALAERGAKSESNVLIEGETGTGKELMAEFIHKNSLRADKPFVVINCASLPDQLIESELFGYEKGAFTDAKSSKQGLVEIANGGTLFLDEIGELSLTLQPKLLRFLENGEFRRVGGLQSIHSNVRVVSATNRDLIEESNQRSFRRDLLFRLNVITLRIPPLRERKDDIVQLAEHFLKAKSPVRSPKELSDEAKSVLLHYAFPGNVRELEHIIERAIIFADANIVRPANLFLPAQSSTAAPAVPDDNQKLQEIETDSPLELEEVEKRHIERILKQNNWEQTKSAVQLGISVKTLYNKIKKFNLRSPSEY